MITKKLNKCGINFSFLSDDIELQFEDGIVKLVNIKTGRQPKQRDSGYCSNKRYCLKNKNGQTSSISVASVEEAKAQFKADCMFR